MDLGPLGQGGFAMDQEGDGAFQKVKPFPQGPGPSPQAVGGAFPLQKGVLGKGPGLPHQAVEQGPNPARGSRGGSSVKGIDHLPPYQDLQERASPGLGEEVNLQGVVLEAVEEGLRALLEGHPLRLHRRSLMHHPGG